MPVLESLQIKQIKISARNTTNTHALQMKLFIFKNDYSFEFFYSEFILIPLFQHTYTAIKNDCLLKIIIIVTCEKTSFFNEVFLLNIKKKKKKVILIRKKKGS